MRLEEYIDTVVAPRDARRALVVTGIAWGGVAGGILVLAFVLPTLGAAWGLSGSETGFLAGQTFLGMLLGAVLAGPGADRLGRRRMAWGLCLLGGLASGGGALATGPGMFALSRLVAGFAFGGLLPVLNAYMCDFCPRKTRGRDLVLLEACWGVGSLVAGGWALAVLPSLGWRWAVAFPAILGFMALPLARGPESPRFLFVTGRTAPLAQRYGTLPEGAAPISGSSFRALFRAPWISRVLLLAAVWSCLSYAYYAVFLWLPKIFGAHGVSFAQAQWFTFLMMAAQLPGYLAAAWAVERFGRVPSLVVALGGTGGCALLFALGKAPAVFLSGALLSSLFCLGGWGILYAYTPELFPTELRGSANGLLGAVARGVGIVAPTLAGWMMDGGGVTGMLITVAAAGLLTAAVVFRWGEETRGRDIR